MKKFLKGFMLFAVALFVSVSFFSKEALAEEIEEKTFSYSLTGSYVNAKGKIVTREFKGTYTGYVNSDGLPSGKGTFTASTKKGDYKYKGKFVAGVIDGKGTATFNGNSCYGSFEKGVYTPTFGDAVYALRKQFETGKSTCTKEVVGIIDQNMGLKKKTIKAKASDLSYSSLLVKGTEYRHDFGFVSKAKVIEVKEYTYLGIKVDEIVAVKQDENGKNQYFALLYNNNGDKEFTVGSKISFYASPVEALKITKENGKKVNCVREVVYYFGK